MTVVKLGTSQPQCRALQGPSQGVSVSSQTKKRKKKGEVDTTENLAVCCVRLLQ